MNGDGQSELVFANVAAGQSTFVVVDAVSGAVLDQVGPIAGDIPMPGYYNSDAKLDFAAGVLSNGRATVNGLLAVDGTPGEARESFSVDLGPAERIMYGCSLLGAFVDSLTIINKGVVIARELGGSVERRIALRPIKDAEIVGCAKVPFSSNEVDKIIYMRAVKKQTVLGFLPCSGVPTDIRTVKKAPRASFAFNAAGYGVPLLTFPGRSMSTDSLSELVKITPMPAGPNSVVTSGLRTNESGAAVSVLLVQANSQILELSLDDPTGSPRTLLTTSPGTLVPHRGLSTARKPK